MPTDPSIPHGYIRITGQTAKGDTKWNGRKFVNVVRRFPQAGDDFVIRKVGATKDPNQYEFPQTSECDEAY